MTQRKPALLVLADGTSYEGESVGATGTTTGELIFNTAMTGYQEIISDPSYAKQIITFTHPHIGNTGCNTEDMESSKAWVAGCVMPYVARTYSNYRADQSLVKWLRQQGIIAIAGVDTRHIVQKIRDQGSMGACITTESLAGDAARQLAEAATNSAGGNLAHLVTRQAIERWYHGQESWSVVSNPLKYHVVAYDFGVKHNILRILFDLGCHVTMVPATTPAQQVMAMNPDGIFLSNGPGDPLACSDAIAWTKVFLDANIPLFGICLGFQILGLACGASSEKMKFGHHGANHPVLDVQHQKVFITSQNHGFAINEQTLPTTLEVTHRSLFDGSLQGFRHRTKLAFGFQGHPEASPGPHDIYSLFNRFIDIMKHKQTQTH